MLVSSPMITIDPPSSPHTVLPPLSRPSLTRFLKRARALVNLPASVAILLTTDAELKRLNCTFRRKNKPTDVLSFPADPIPGLPTEHQHVGDLAISIETAARQAEQFGHTVQQELQILILHGLLHLAGLDHETDTGEMAARELDLRTRLRLPVGLIDRTLHPVPRRSATPIKPSPRTSSTPRSRQTRS
jgi:probable rRNA maturation factor